MSRSRHIAPLALAAAALLLAGCALVSVSQREEIQMGRDYSSQLNEELPLVDDDAIRGYVDRVGTDIASRTDRPDLPYEFQVVNTDVVNAFAVPGGFIYMNRGLLEASENMSEVAGVLAHEVAHVVARHSAEQMERARSAGLALGVGSILLGEPRGAARAGIGIGANLYFARYSRAQESEADSLAVGYLVRSGWDPDGLVRFFETLQEMRERRPNALEALFTSHPLTEDRVEHVRRIIDRLPADSLRGLRTSSGEYRTMKEALERLPPPPEEYRVEGDRE
ncbi:MAG: M48 family metallopeptidase [Candidatus Palauibacterales bacterium]|nr:M48 family metallopeptidase [Candidatus Palauibacterales bacterium]